MNSAIIETTMEEAVETLKVKVELGDVVIDRSGNCPRVKLYVNLKE